MQKLLILLVALMTFHACNSLSSTPNKSNNDQNAELPQTTGPDGSDLLKTLQGRWQSEEDSTCILEIIDTKMRHFNAGKLSAETDIEIDGSCLTTPCKLDSTDLTDGWCFMEKGQHDVQCNIVLSCDKEYLKYRGIGASNALLVFKKQ
jgi:hypothetical protein